MVMSGGPRRPSSSDECPHAGQYFALRSSKVRPVQVRASRIEPNVPYFPDELGPKRLDRKLRCTLEQFTKPVQGQYDGQGLAACKT